MALPFEVDNYAEENKWNCGGETGVPARTALTDMLLRTRTRLLLALHFKLEMGVFPFMLPGPVLAVMIRVGE